MACKKAKNRIQSYRISHLPRGIEMKKNSEITDINKLAVDQHPEFLELVQNDDAFNFGRLYENLEKVISEDEKKIPQCLDIIRSKISDPTQTSFDLKKAYELLGKIKNKNQYNKQATEILLNGLNNIQNSTISKKEAYRQLGKVDELTSRIYIGTRAKKTNAYPHGFKFVNNISPDETAILFLGGNGTNSERIANGYLSDLEKLMDFHKVRKKVSLYAVVYDFGEIEDSAVTFNDYFARKKLIQEHHRNVKISQQLNEDTLHPRYVDDLFNKVFLERICDKNNNRLSIEDACAKIRKLTVVAHCHGAYTFLKLEEKMQHKMKELGYSRQEQAQIQKELLCVAHAPFAPLGVSKSTMISFVSAQDWEIRHYNNFEKEIRPLSKNNKVLLSYFPDKKGEMFLAPSLGEDVEQHGFLGYNTNKKGLNVEGKFILGLSGNIIANGVKNSLSGKPLPPVKEIACGQNKKLLEFFDKLQENGKKMWQQISLNTAIRLKAQHTK